MKHANYKVVGRTIASVVIRDLGPWDKHPTITNDAEHVVARLFAATELRPGQRLFYWDSEGILTEIILSGNKFKGFASCQKSTAISTPMGS